MAESEKTYQPHWGEKRSHHHHHYRESRSTQRNRGMGGALRMKDKQAYYGLMCVLGLVAVYALFLLGRLIVEELRAMPMDDPSTERAVDELRIHKVEEHDALLYSDSLAQAYNIDSIKHVQIETRPVYRPPKRENVWYITQREWKDIWRNMQRWKQSKKNDARVKKSEKGKQE